MSNTALDPAELAAALIRRPSVTPKDEGALVLNHHPTGKSWASPATGWSCR